VKTNRSIQSLNHNQAPMKNPESQQTLGKRSTLPIPRRRREACRRASPRPYLRGAGGATPPAYSPARLWGGSIRAVRPDPDPPAPRVAESSSLVPASVDWTQVLEETPTTAAPHGDAARLLPILRLAPLRPQVQLDPPRSPATQGARPATPRSTTADRPGVSERSTVVRTAVSSYIASSGMKRRSSQKSSGEPSAGNLHAGFCLGRRVQEATLAR
jgi:hypothetical protein